MAGKSKRTKRVLTPEQRQHLERLRRSRTAPVREAQRAEILWRYHCGETIAEIVVTILNPIYEEDFRSFSYGFRPGRQAHHARDSLTVGLMRKKVNWGLDADIRGLFEHIDYEWLVKFLDHRVGDRRVLRLIQKWLKAGVSEPGHWSETKVGTPQGAVISPLLANIYLHYVFDLWVEAWRRKCAQGDVVVVRYADDFVLGFERRAEGERFLDDLRERFAKFGLELHPEKTRLIEFGHFAHRTGESVGRGRRRLLTSWGSRIFAGRTRRRAISWCVVRRRVNGWRRSCRQ